MITTQLRAPEAIDCITNPASIDPVGGNAHIATTMAAIVKDRLFRGFELASSRDTPSAAKVCRSVRVNAAKIETRIKPVIQFFSSATKNNENFRTDSQVRIWINDAAIETAKKSREICGKNLFPFPFKILMNEVTERMIEEKTARPNSELSALPK
ncbi:hypothetical protein [Xanthomonas campestris]|nr:hypothetical protein [Xanthomonas campestris]QLC68578.1 hypothetical protein AD14011_02975 [Xanthomonas campestris pv. raphani]